MNIKTQQPVEMKGDPNARYSFKQLTIGEPFQNEKNHWLVNLRYDDVIICTVYGIDKMEALDNAARFIQATNMHDELIEALKRLTDAHYNGKVQGANWMNASEILKQAKQK